MSNVAALVVCVVVTIHQIFRNYHYFRYFLPQRKRRSAFVTLYPILYCFRKCFLDLMSYFRTANPNTDHFPTLLHRIHWYSRSFPAKHRRKHFAAVRSKSTTSWVSEASLFFRAFFYYFSFSLLISLSANPFFSLLYSDFTK